jgi:two-component system sensor histidine kinase YesM
MEIARMDEMGRLATSMNHMTRHIKALLETVQKEQERLRWAELKALQAQINPHFLYNTLDSIKWLVRTGEHDKADEMIAALTDFFRKVLSQGKDFISIEDEVNHVDSYLKIQKIRYHKTFDYSIYVEEGLEGCMIPKLLLQPIVENAIYHGIKPGAGVKNGGKILIHIVSAKADLVLEVRDNGVGMTEARKAEVLGSFERCQNDRSESYGMGNVNDRIHILAGSAYGIKIISEEGLGTSVSISLPKMSGGGPDDVSSDDRR